MPERGVVIPDDEVASLSTRNVVGTMAPHTEVDDRVPNLWEFIVVQTWVTMQYIGHHAHVLEPGRATMETHSRANACYYTQKPWLKHGS